MKFNFRPQLLSKKLKNFLYVAVFVLAALPLSVQAADSPSKPDGRFFNSPGLKEYPNACAIILEDDLTYRLNEDYSAEATEYNAIKLLNGEGVKLFRLYPRNFDASFETVEFEYARSISPQGQVTEVPAGNIKTIAAISGAPIYEDRQIYVAEFPNLEVGSVIEYSIKTKYAPRKDKQWWACSYLQNDLPILHSTYKVSVPSQEKAYTFTNVPYLRSPKVTESKGVRTYSWETKEAFDAITSNVSMPSSFNYYKYVAASSFSDWKDLSKWAAAIWDENTADNDTSLSMLCTRITSVGKPAEERIQDVLGYMSKFSILDKDQNIWRSVDFKRATLSKLLTYQDAAYLTGALLRRAGLRVDVYMASSSDLKTMAQLPPIPTYFSQFLLKVSDPGGKTWWIDPSLPGSALNAPNLGWQGSAMLELPSPHSSKPGRLVAAPIDTPEDNICSYNMEGRIEANGIGQLNADITYNGPRANILRTAEGQAQALTDAQHKEMVNWIIGKFNNNFCFQTIPYANFFPAEIDAQSPVTVGTSVQFANYARYSRERDRFETPLPITQGQSLQAGLNSASRLYPVRFDAPFIDEVSYHVILPQDSKVVAQPRDMTLSNDVGSYTCKTVVKGSEVWFYSRTQINLTWIYKDKFAQLEELAKAQLSTFKSPLAYKLTLKVPTEKIQETEDEASQE